MANRLGKEWRKTRQREREDKEREKAEREGKEKMITKQAKLGDLSIGFKNVLVTVLNFSDNRGEETKKKEKDKRKVRQELSEKWLEFCKL